MPLKKTKLHTNNQPWITPEFITLIKRRQEAFAQKKMTEFRQYRNLVNRERKRLRDNYFSMKVIHLKGTKPAVWWRELKRISGMQPNSNNENIFTQLKFDEDDYQGNPEEIANRINEAFLQPMREYEPLSSNPFNNGEFGPDLETFELTELDTYNLLRRINPRKASGPDGIPNWLCKTYAEILAKPVCNIINSSFDEHRLPSMWKHADIIPVPKVKPATDVNKHLRPISLTPSISKVAEEFVITKYIAPAIMNTLDPDQYGAIPKSSSVLALISMIHEWSQATDKSGATVRVTLFDYRKAFDLVDHSILIKKLQNMTSLPRKVCSWITDFLSNRYQRVKLADALSSWRHVPSGVPQGTKLGPWLFLLMVNDLRVNSISTWKFVDDTTISEIIPKNSLTHTQSAATSVEKWSADNKLHLNAEKCKELRIDFKRVHQEFDPIKVDNVPLKIVDHAKILGLIISNSLQWNLHVDHVIKKANKRLYCPVQLKRANVPEADIVNFYCTCIRPTLEYASQVFHHSLPKYLSDDLERVQKRSLAIIYRGQPYSESLQQSGLNALSVRRQTLCEKLFLKISTDSDHKLHALLPPKHQAKYNLRHKRLYDLPMANTNRFRNTFVPSMIYYNN